MRKSEARGDVKRHALGNIQPGHAVCQSAVSRTGALQTLSFVIVPVSPEASVQVSCAKLN